MFGAQVGDSSQQYIYFNKPVGGRDKDAESDWYNAPSAFINSTIGQGDLSDLNGDDDLDQPRLDSEYFGNHATSVWNAPPGHHTTGGGSYKHEMHKSKKFCFYLSRFKQKYAGYALVWLLIVFSLLSTILFISAPKIASLFETGYEATLECQLDCQSGIMGIAFKQAILIIGLQLMHWRHEIRNTLPKMNQARVLIVVLLFIVDLVFWVFYGVEVFGGDEQKIDMIKCVHFASSHVDVMIFVFILGVFLSEIRHLRSQFIVTVFRSPDGEHKSYSLGQMSIQQASLHLLQSYYRDFKPFNPWLDVSRQRRAIQLHQFNQQQKVLNSSARSHSSSKSQRKDNTSLMLNTKLNASDRITQELEYERRVKKREAKLICVCEEAFGHVKRVMSNNSMDMGNSVSGGPIMMDPHETAQAIFSTIARDLRRYLRLTKQQPYFPRESVLDHLAECIAYDISPQTFLAKYFQNGESIGMNERALAASNNINLLASSNYNFDQVTMEQNWLVLSDQKSLYQNIEHGLKLVLKQNEVSLVCEFKRLPRFSIAEDMLDMDRNKFLIKLNSETTV